jgi:hypothetical protein
MKNDRVDCKKTKTDAYDSSSTIRTNGATRKHGAEIRLPVRGERTIASLSAHQPLLSPDHALNGKPKGISAYGR